MLSGASVRWTDPSTGAQIQVDTIPWGTADAADHWRNFAREVRAKNTLPGFQELGLRDHTVVQRWPAADLEYTWETRDHGRLRALDRGFTANGRQYAILVAAPAGQWSRYEFMPAVISDAFQPGR